MYELSAFKVRARAKQGPAYVSSPFGAKVPSPFGAYVPGPFGAYVPGPFGAYVSGPFGGQEPIWWLSTRPAKLLCSIFTRTSSMSDIPMQLMSVTFP